MALSQNKIKQLKKDFEAAEIPITELVKKHEVGRTTIYRLAAEHNWKGKQRNKPAVPKPKPEKGRPEKYNGKEHPAQATALCMLGFTNEQLASFFNVVEQTIYNWKKEHPEFLEALRNGREKGSAKVAVSLFQRACGYSHEDEKIFCQDGEIIRAKITKHYPPETKAIALWLKNKYPELWRDKQEIEASHEMKIGKITEEDIKVVEKFFDDITE